MSQLIRKSRGGHAVRAADAYLMESMPTDPFVSKDFRQAARDAEVRVRARNDAKVRFIPRSLPVNNP